MRLSHISIQKTTILTVNSKIKSEELEEEIKSRINSNITQISVFNSRIDMSSFPKMNNNIQTLAIKNTPIKSCPKGRILGKNLKTV